MTEGPIVKTHNGYGWTSTVPNQITLALLEWLSTLEHPDPLVVDIGAGLGVGTLPLLDAGARVIALDLEESHLASIRQEAETKSVADRLTTLKGAFPGALGFDELDAIHCSNVLHFLAGSDIEAGAAKMHEWPKPGGKVFLQVGTVYAGHIKRLLPVFVERRCAGVRWAGETDNARDLVDPEFRDATPVFMNYLDETPLVDAFEKAGFIVEKGWYYTRNGLPERLRGDGREHYGLIAQKPSARVHATSGDVVLQDQVTPPKQAALESMARLLPSYKALQEHYSSHVHLPDYRAFSGQWEDSLYRPIRNAMRSATDGQTAGNLGALLYCAPGAHAPLLQDDGGPALLSRFREISLLDIDAAALRCASNKLQALTHDTMIEAIACDFSGPFGQRLCDVYFRALNLAESPTVVAEKLGEPFVLTSSIFSDADQVLVQLCAELDAASRGRRYTYAVSEMVASFTGTAAWLAFRSALYQRFAKQSRSAELVECLSAATLVWQIYNECFLGFHLKLMRRQIGSDGLLLLAFDTRKVYDDSEHEMLPVFPSETTLATAMEVGEFRILRHAVLSWRDHPRGFDVSLCGIPVSDFQPHTHEVELLTLEVGN